MRRALTLSLALLVLGGCASLPSGNLIEMQQEADSAYAAGDYPRASALYARLASAMPTDAGIRYQYGNSLARQGEHAGAVEQYRAALLRDSQHARAWHNLLQVQMQQARLTAGEMQSVLSEQSPHAPKALERARQVLEAHP